MPFRVGGKGGGEGGAIAVPNDLRFAGATEPICEAARITFFNDNNSRLVKGVQVILEPTNQPIILQEYDGSVWRNMTSVVKGNQGDPASNLVQSVQGRTGNVTITKNDLSLQNVDNTSDLNKPVSTAVQTALDAKANTAHTHSKANITDLESDLNTINTALSNLNTNKQDKLTSGTTIKTVNGNSLLGSGNIVIDAVQEATSAVTGGIRLTGDLGGSALSPSVTKINGVAVSNTGIAAGKVLKATSGNTAVFDNITAADVGAIPTSAKGVIDGVAELDGNGKLPSARLPAGIVQSVNGLTGIVTITKNTLSLGSVDNTADADKPLSNDAKTALNLKVDKSAIGANSGVCELDGNGKIPSSRISALPTGETFVVANAAARLALSAAKGDVAIQQDTEESYRLKDVPATLPTNWVKLLFPASVQSVNSKTGNVTITKADLNLGNVDNTSDLGKPISADTQTALNTKVDKTVLSAKGSLLTHSGSALAPHAVGTDGQVLKSDSTSPTGLKWETLPAALTINNTLTSDATNEPLSAAQGKVLKNLVDTKAGTAVATTSTNGLMSSADKTKLDGLDNTTIVDGLTDTSATKALSANQGKVLKDLVDTKASKTLASNAPTIIMLADGGENIDAENISCTAFEQDVIPAIGDLVKAGNVWATADTSVVNIVPSGPNGYIITLSKPTTFEINDGDQLHFTGAGKDGLMSKSDKGKLDGLSNTVVNDTLTSTSTTEAASARTVKVAYDVAMGKPFLSTSVLPVGFGTAALGTSNQAAKADHVHPTPPKATTTADGLMSKEDKTKVDKSAGIGFYDVASTYKSGDICLLRGMLIQANADITANTAFKWGTSGATWSLKYDTNTSFKGPYKKGTAYTAGNLITFSDSLVSPIVLVNIAFTSGSGAANDGEQFNVDLMWGGALHANKVVVLFGSASGMSFGEYAMVAATQTVAGRMGAVYAPAAGQQNHIFTGAGWRKMPYGIGATMGRRISGTQSIPTATGSGTVVLFDSTDSPPENAVSDCGITYNNGAFTSNVDNGTFLITYQIIVPSASSGNALTWVRYAGDPNNRFAVQTFKMQNGVDAALNGSCVLSPANGTKFEICVYQDSGVSLNIGHGIAGTVSGYSTRCSVTRLA